MDRARAEHWREAWKKAGLATGRRVEGRGKFYALVAYPGTSGFLHVGHPRGYAYVDPLARYHRMLGEAVLLPFGIHASGLPAVTFAQRVKDREPLLLRQLSDRGVPESETRGLEEPEAAARFLGEQYREIVHALGALVDDSTYVTTIDDDYHAFIRWQFKTLKSLGALGQGTHYASYCPVCGPVAVDPSETDLSSGGDAEVVRFTTVPFRLSDGRILLAATLRPETVYGVTNLWVHPDHPLTVWHHPSGTYLASKAGVERLFEQHGGRIGHEVVPSELIGHEVMVPFLNVPVPVLAGTFVDPSVGTGVVMSVPAHAPADAVALAELPEPTRRTTRDPRVLLEIPADVTLTASEQELMRGHGTPADRALQAVGAKGPSDRTSVDAATERLYRLEYVRGRMTVPELSGILVREARDRVAADLEAAGTSFDLQEFSKPVICRNGHSVIIRRVPDQWFLKYGDEEWKASVRRVVDRLFTWPADYGRELPTILDWFQDRPCTRRGRWLGTSFPFDPEWVIEPIADSTFYMAYFIVRRFVSAGRLKLEHLTDALFDFVFRGIGAGEPTVDRATLDELRAEFLFWYPLDLNVGGKEHKRVHFPVFLYTHARLLPPELQPKGIYVHGWTTGPAGAKISKREASTWVRIPSVEAAIEEWGADAIRLLYSLAGSPSQDLEWDQALVEASVVRIGDVERMAREAFGAGAGSPELDAWLASVMHRTIREIRRAFDAADLRTVAELTYVRLPSLLRRYYARGGGPCEATTEVARAWIRLLSPITPFLAEELGEGRFPTLVAAAPFPGPEEFPRSEVAEAREEFLERVEDDLRAVLKPGLDRGEGAPEEVAFYVAAPWKATVEGWLRETAGRGESPSVKEVLERTGGHPEMTAYRAEIARFVQRVGPLVRTEPPPPSVSVDEDATLRAAEGYLSRRFGFRQVSVYREEAAAPHDPLHRRDRARPGRPAFYLVKAPTERRSG